MPSSDIAMGNTPLLQSNPLRTAEGLAEASVRRHCPAFLTRGGAVGRARAELARGLNAADAAAVAAKWGKGHAAELRLASEHSLDAAIRELPFQTRPNALANDPHVDLEVFENKQLADTVQVGVGNVSYLRRKALTSCAGGFRSWAWSSRPGGLRRSRAQSAMRFFPPAWCPVPATELRTAI